MIVRYAAETGFYQQISFSASISSKILVYEVDRDIAFWARSFDRMPKRFRVICFYLNILSFSPERRVQL